MPATRKVHRPGPRAERTLAPTILGTPSNRAHRRRIRSRGHGNGSHERVRLPTTQGNLECGSSVSVDCDPCWLVLRKRKGKRKRERKRERRRKRPTTRNGDLCGDAF